LMVLGVSRVDGSLCWHGSNCSLGSKFGM
jgi:hypothetical protein